VADRVLIMENAYYSVISPEGCAAILWKDRTAAPKAAEALRITSPDLRELGLVDGVIPEPLGGAHTDTKAVAATLRERVLAELEALGRMSAEDRLKGRYDKFRAFGHFEEATAAKPAEAEIAS
jgi:acetyl-CoA carboxylase carboxyl transferase subunit alpha